jgi:phenylacetate-CoA ligase
MKNNVELLTNWIIDKSFFDSLDNNELLCGQGQQIAFNLFHDASQRVPAYKDFLKKQGIKPTLIKKQSDLQYIPPTTKENYITAYDFKERCWDGKLDGMHMLSTSSGTTGDPLFWPRNLETEIQGAYAHEFLFRQVFCMDRKKTLFINGFALGNWIAGTFTSACVNLVSMKGYPITMASPGYLEEGILDVIERIASHFEQVVISGHIPFLKEVVESGKARGIDWGKFSVKLLGTGQGITENWRHYVLSLLESDDYFSTIINLYGSADASLMGFETPLSICLRKILSQDSKRVKDLFHSERLPSIYNYDPRLTFFEAVDGELAITKNSGCPLIRYNIHDEGGVFSEKDLLSFFSDFELNSAGEKTKLDVKKYKLPFVYLFGRDKFMVKIFGANIYSEHVQHALTHEKLQPLITGRYILEVAENEKRDPELICRIELGKQVEERPEMANMIKDVFVEEIRKINSEYNFVLEKLDNKVKPKILLYSHGHPVYFPQGKIKKNG